MRTSSLHNYRHFLKIEFLKRFLIASSMTSCESSSSTIPSQRRQRHRGGQKRKRRDQTEQGERSSVADAGSIPLAKPQKKAKFFDEGKYSETSYYFENGLRKVHPYYYTFSTHCKGRWLGLKLHDIFKKEFRSESPEFYAAAINSGMITINGSKASLDYVMKNNDFLESRVHRHEPPVTGQPIDVIVCNDDIAVINKPASIPVHPSGRYRHNTIVFLLGKEYDLKNLHTIHRLDRLTSGLLMFARSLEMSQKLDSYVRERKLQKTYICRVKGEFPSEPVECCEPIKTMSHKIGVCRVSPEGKECQTNFYRKSYNGTSSVVICEPHTGRMHQIRVHLQYLGYPIMNDPLYNNPVWGKDVGKGGVNDLPDDEILSKLIERNNRENDATLLEDKTNEVLDHIKEQNMEVKSKEQSSNIDGKCVEPIVELQNTKETEDVAGITSGDEANKVVKQKDVSCDVVDAMCKECRLKHSDPLPHQMIMYLHALTYKGPDFEYSTPMPEWASENWKEPDELIDREK